MNDLISRKALQTSIRREPEIIVNGLRYVRTDMVSAKISMAPGVEAIEVERGKWDENRFFLCNVCNKCSAVVERPAIHAGKWNFCPNCGAWMFVAKEDSDG